MKRYSTTGPAMIMAVPTIPGDLERGIPSTSRFLGYSQAVNSDGVQGYGGLAENEYPEITGVITVAAAAFPSFDTFILGPFRLQESVHFLGVDGDVPATAAALAAAINGLPGWTASADGDEVTVTVLQNQLGEILFRVQNRKDPVNFTLSTDTGYITGQILFSPVELL